MLIEIDAATMTGAAPLWDHLLKSVRGACESASSHAAIITHESTEMITERNR
ncbi:hypothetical protein [Amycolatopsis coloradensis]|uniref:hypothetical protein n=1 Tax=Amycolatopsis coloradensis TaxID=76021 RepID=UPI001ABFF101|nr:hypothetical protein [Amycolatopsis coloradensis]